MILKILPAGVLLGMAVWLLKGDVLSLIHI